MLDNLMLRHKENLYVVFRVMIGLLMSQHGFQKVFGMLGAEAAQPLLSLMWFVGVVELLGGLGIAFGVFTRLSAFGNIIIMIAGFFMAHFNAADFPAGWIPVMNRGEMALIYLAAFIVIFGYGAGKASLERMVLKKELF